MINNKEPLSLVIPVRNGERYIERSLKYILANVSESDEILIVDDNSTDLGIKEAIRLIGDDERFRIIRNPKRGIVSALNLGIREATNDWIARFDVDDEYLETRLEQQRSLISGDVVGIFCDYKFIAEDDTSLGTIPSAITALAVPISLYSTQRTPHPGAIFNKKAFFDVGGFREQDSHAEDLSLWLRLSRAGSLVSVPETLLRYRISASSTMGKNRRSAITKSRELFRELSLDHRIVNRCVEEISTIFQIYDQNTQAAERKILLLRDLYLYKTIVRGKNPKTSNLFARAIRLSANPENVLGLKTLARGKLVRKRYRSSD